MVTIILLTILTMVNINNKVTMAILITASFNPLNCQFFTPACHGVPSPFAFSIGRRRCLWHRSHQRDWLQGALVAGDGRFNGFPSWSHEFNGYFRKNLQEISFFFKIVVYSENYCSFLHCFPSSIVPKSICPKIFASMATRSKVICVKTLPTNV